MKKTKLIALFCVILIFSMPIAFAQPFTSNTNPYSTPASQRASDNPQYGAGLGGYVYTDPYADEIRRASGGFSYGPEQYLGDAIIVYVGDYDPPQVRQSALEQQDSEVYLYLKGLTAGTLLSPFTDDPTARDPLSGLTNIPLIDRIDVLFNSSSPHSKYVRFVKYIPPRFDKYSLNNLGMVVVFLKKLASEKDMPPDNTIVLDMNARIYLRPQSDSLLGISQQDLVVKPFPDETKFLENKEDFSFFSGKGYVRATRIDANSVTLLVYNRDLRPLSLYSPSSSAPITQGLRQPVPITLSITGSNQISQPISFGLTGNPLNDLFQIKLEGVSTPSNKAEIELALNGRDVRRKVSEGRELYSGSNWRVKLVSNNDQYKIVSLSNIDDIAKEFNLNTQLKDRLASKISTLGEGQIQARIHRVILENKLTEQTKTIERYVLFERDDPIFKTIPPIAGAQAEFLEDKYCGEPKNSDVTEDDFACTAINKYKKLIKDYPTSKEAEAAKKDLAEIYANQLIDYKPCGKKVDDDKCLTFKQDNQELAAYYYTQTGEDKTFDLYGGKGGDDFLEDEGISIKLIRSITAQEEKPKVDLRLFTDIGKFEEKIGLEIGSVIEFPGLGSSIKYKNDINYVWRLDSVYPSTATLRLYKIKGTNSKGEVEYSKTDVPQVSLELNKAKQVTVSFPEITPGTTESQKPAETRNIMLTRTDTKYEAYLTVIPGAGRAFTTSNFRLNIPIDPRPFKLTPEQMQSHINKTQSMIKDLNSAISSLDETVTTMKKMCLGAFAFLTLKNSLTGTRNIARLHVSQSFKAKCERASLENPDKYPTIERCLADNTDEMTKSIDKTEEYIDEINKNIKGKTVDDLSELSDSNCGEFKKFSEASKALGARNQDIIKKYRDCVLYSKIKDDENLDENYKEFIEQKFDELEVKKRQEVYDRAKAIADQNPNDAFDGKNLGKVIIQIENSEQKTKDINLIQIEVTNEQPGLWMGETILKDTAGNLVPIKMNGVSQYDKLLYDNDFDEEKAQESICKNNLGSKWNNHQCESNLGRNINLISTIESLNREPAQEGPYQLYTNGDFYTQTAGGRNKLNVNTKDKCEAAGGEWKGILSKSCQPIYYSSSTIVDTAGRQINQFYSEDSLPAYFDKDGLPNCYPTGKGEYVRVIEPYQGPSQRISKLEVLNVGPNGRIECGFGDDEIVHRADKIDLLSQKKDFYRSKGEQLKRCKTDGEVVGPSIDGKKVICKTKLPGDITTAILDPKCTDVMDPTDCKWLFNFCDPVMCPSSRCTMGGTVPPRNVIQSGVFGSTLLCLPNIKEGIVLPVCLTGVSAGLKALRSVLQGYTDCLKIKLESNQDVGICDYLGSVGICEVVWRETYNLLDIGGRGLINWASGKIFSEPKGGGEYLRFHSSLENVGASVNVFTKEYETTYTAQFLAQPTEEIGSQLCRLSVNGRLPNFGKILDQLTEPENPPQFTAFFDETPYAAPGEALPTSTVQPGTEEISQYRTFYHIYAGTGFFQGAYSQPQSLFNQGTKFGPPQPITYSVYLVNKEAGYPPLFVTFPDEIGLLQTTGRVEAGQYAQKTVEKRGRKGYNQVCINLNGVEQCGFRRVSSSFGIKELGEALEVKEAKKKIESASECVPDSEDSKSYSVLKLSAVAGASALGGIAPGLATSGIEKDVTTTGIIRTCSVEPPTPEPGRWKEVGTCGKDERSKVLGSCWLDIESISIENVERQKELVKEIEGRAKKNFEIIDANRAKEILFSLNKERDDILQSIRNAVEEAKKSKVTPATTFVTTTTPVGTAAITPTPGPTTPEPEEEFIPTATTNKGIELETELTPLIEQGILESGHKIDPLFIRSIIWTETRWEPENEQNKVSPCGAAGLAQIMPHTAGGLTKNGAQLNKILNLVPKSNIKYKGSGCDINYGEALKDYVKGKDLETLKQEDDRFDNEKAIKALIIYFSVFTIPKFNQKAVSLSLENMASSYNMRVNGTITALQIKGEIPLQVQQDYITKVLEAYNRVKPTAKKEDIVVEQ